MELFNYNTIITTIQFQQYQIGVLRLDLIDPDVSGNKWFKLKHNINQAILEHKTSILTFGGAFSNHIAATAKVCQLANLQSIGIIRGEETALTNSTLSVAIKNGMQLHFVTRENYQNKNSPFYLTELQQKHPHAYIVPEGGDNELGEKGCSEILMETTNKFDRVFCAFGTGTTFKGIAQSLKTHQQLTAINVLKFDAGDISMQATVNNNYHFGGYAKHTPQLLEFKTWFETEYHLELDYVYTAKLFYAVFDLMKKETISPLHKLLIIHSGGLQGNEGYKKRYNL